MRWLGIIAGILGFTAVGLGAFGARALDGRLSEEAQEWWSTAGFYLLPHAVAVLVASQIDRLRAAGWLWATGSAIFAAALYAMALGTPRWFGAITPIGGVLLLAGWGMVILQAGRKTPSA